MTTFAPGELVELEVGAVAHGGFCVSRSLGRVCFVRHALPGEFVRARVTEDRGGSFLRADAVEILTASADRVPAPCPHAGPGRCGGCDWQHASGTAQRRLKTDVVREQFARIARHDLPPSFEVEELPSGGPPGSGGVAAGGGLLGWRTRVTYAVGPSGGLGLHRAHSHEIELVEACPLGAPGVGDSDALHKRWHGFNAIEVVGGTDGRTSLVGHRPSPRTSKRGRRPPDRLEHLDGPEQSTFAARGRRFHVAAGGFWQVHPAALDTFAGALLDGLAVRPGEYVLDLYAGAGALTAFLADAVGPSGRVVGIESSRQAVADAVGNLADVPHAAVLADQVRPEVVATTGRPDLVVLDPPRSGAGREVMRAVLDLAPRAIGYVACDPAALARDCATAFSSGWALRSIRGFDAFPMTHHIECVAILEPAP